MCVVITESIASSTWGCFCRCLAATDRAPGRLSDPWTATSRIARSVVPAIDRAEGRVTSSLAFC